MLETTCGSNGPAVSRAGRPTRAREVYRSRHLFGALMKDPTTRAQRRRHCSLKVGLQILAWARELAPESARQRSGRKNRRPRSGVTEGGITEIRAVLASLRVSRSVKWAVDLVPSRCSSSAVVVVEHDASLPRRQSSA